MPSFNSKFRTCNDEPSMYEALPVYYTGVENRFMESQTGSDLAWDIFERMTIPQMFEFYEKLKLKGVWDAKMAGGDPFGFENIAPEMKSDFVKLIGHYLGSYLVSVASEWQQNIDLIRADLPRDWFCDRWPCPHRKMWESYTDRTYERVRKLL